MYINESILKEKTIINSRSKKGRDPKDDKTANTKALRKEITFQ